MAGTEYRALFLVGVVLLTAQLCGCTAYVVVGSGFSVELIHRDSAKSPFHDPSLTAHARVLAAVRRSKARAAALGPAGGSPDGAVSELVPRPFEYLMAVNVGTPLTRMLAVADTGSDLVWLKCSNGSSSTADHPPSSDAAAAFDPSSSSTYGLVGCQSGACHSLPGSSCDARSNCKYVRSYPDAPQMPGLLSTETFTFDDAPGGGCAGCRDCPQLVVPGVDFGCSSIDTAVPTGFVGLGAGNLSMISQIGAATSLGRRFSYCLAPYSVNASSALNFGSRAAVTEPGAVTTQLRPTPSAAASSSFYTVELESVKIGNSTFTLPYRSSNVVVDSGTALTYLDKLLLDPMVEELTRRINLTRMPSPEALLELCFDVGGVTQDQEWALEKVVPDVTLELGGGAVVTLRPENTFVEVEEGVMCLAMAPVTQEQPVAVIGNFAQQNMHVGYDLDKRTITFAPADCASSYPSPPASLAS
uniref:Uncharacterized protein n=1 Tax=Avena sativa TaxID=4498 RepID=A0ACD5WS81_AVESA